MKYSKQHVHLTMDQLEAIASFNAEALSETELSAVMDMEEKISECPVCMARYRFFTESELTLHSLQQLAPSGLSALGQLLQDQLSALDERMQQTVTRWLDSAQAVLQSLSGAALRPAAAGASRGAGRGAAADIMTVPAGEGSFRFTLDKRTEVVFRVPRSTDSGKPAFLLVQGCEGTDFTGVYPLTGLELPGLVSPLLDSPGITLEPGSYLLTVPTIDE